MDGHTCGFNDFILASPLLDWQVLPNFLGLHRHGGVNRIGLVSAAGPTFVPDEIRAMVLSMSLSFALITFAAAFEA